MALSVKKMREIVFQLLYSRSFEKSDREGVLPFMMRLAKTPRSEVRRCEEMADSVWEKLVAIDEKIAGCSKDFELERISAAEKAILRLGIYELQHSDVPPKVVISEAVRIAKKYASPNGATFVNALLDGLYKEEKEHADLASEEQATL